MERRTDFNPLKDLHQIASLICEITGESLDCVMQRLEEERLHPGRTVARDFRKSGGQRYRWGPHMEAFYRSSSAFLYELAIWNRNGLKIGIRQWTARHMALKLRPLEVLNIGDGLGFDTLYYARKGHRVTYFELPGYGERFARELFRQTDHSISIITDPAAIPAGGFDAVTCCDVLEHVPDPPAMVRTLASYLKPGGCLYASAPFYMIYPWYPTHLKRNRRFSGSLKIYRQAGLRPIGGQVWWCPVVLEKSKPGEALQADITDWRFRLVRIYQWLGRISAWPFWGIHTLRWACSRWGISPLLPRRP